MTELTPHSSNSWNCHNKIFICGRMSHWKTPDEYLTHSTGSTLLKTITTSDNSSSFFKRELNNYKCIYFWLIDSIRLTPPASLSCARPGPSHGTPKQVTRNSGTRGGDRVNRAVVPTNWNSREGHRSFIKMAGRLISYWSLWVTADVWENKTREWREFVRVRM